MRVSPDLCAWSLCQHVCTPQSVSYSHLLKWCCGVPSLALHAHAWVTDYFGMMHASVKTIGMVEVGAMQQAIAHCVE